MRVPLTVADDYCVDESVSSFMARFWYVWFLIIIVVFGFIMGVSITCLQLHCCASKSPAPAYPGQHFEVAVVGVDNESTVHSIGSVSSSSEQNPSGPPSHVFATALSFLPPPYQLYALESPPQYEDAVKMPVEKGAGESGCGVGTDRTPSADTADLGHEMGPQGSADSPTWEEDPPEYQLYDTIVEEGFTEIRLNEDDPSQGHPVDSHTS
ncbi:hypothetical protein Z043_122355 [Scleropages formosus]|uniref:Transmembrane protein 52 n=1 Tax=Scleropages formosus TaxID=113540 RepID=A0A0P7W9R4_SCLFO|nr:hypothetical protein Z043_122355 [Scleropages formosus]